MIVFPANEPPVEAYINTRAIPPCENLRWWVSDSRIMGGGSIVDADDWEHLRKDLEITHVLNLDNKSDAAIVPDDRLCEIHVNDNGMVIAPPVLQACCLFAERVLSESPENALYVHSGNGGARAPAIIYAILRGFYRLSHEDGLVALNTGFPHSASYEWSYLDGHQCAIGSIDCWIDRGGLG